MSDATSRMKVSREGMILIKSFEGFRPRAVRDEAGRWTIGYGHTLSAREGVTVTEAEAELLLQYDLIPVVKLVNEQVAATLNQHQFDALVSFALSIGPERFLASDVARRLNAGALGEAADALIGWPEPTSPETALRRRAAERALFVADPTRAVTLADLMAAPLPPPRVGRPGAEARAAAVATLLGEAPVVEATPPAAEPTAEAEPPTEPPAAPVAAQPLTPTASTQFQRYSPYAAAVIGPLPGFAPAVTPENASEVRVTFQASVTATLSSEAVVASDDVSEEATAPEAAVLPSAPTSEPGAAGEPPAPAPESQPELPAEAEAPTVVEAPVAAFALTPGEAEAPVERPVWAEQQRQTPPTADQEPLFDEEPGVVSVLRHEEIPQPRRLDGATIAFLMMGGTGLGAFAASAASFRRAMADTSGLGDFTMIGWALAVIGGVCVIASSLSLYVRLGRKKDE